MAKKKNAIDVNKVIEAIEPTEYEATIRYGEDEALKIKVKTHLTFEERIEFVHSVVDGCFAEDVFYPLNLDIGFSMNALLKLTNLKDFMEISDILKIAETKIGCDIADWLFYDCFRDKYANADEREDKNEKPILEVHVGIKGFFERLYQDCWGEVKWRQQLLLNNVGTNGLVNRLNVILEKLDNGLDNFMDFNKEDIDKIIGVIGDAVKAPEEVAKGIVNFEKAKAEKENGEA